MRTVAILGLLLLLVLAWTQWPRAADQVLPPTGATTTDPGAGGTPASGEVAAAAAAAPAASVETTAERTAAPALPAGPEAVLRGRCVDEQGLPIAGVEAQLSGVSGSRERMEAWRRDHDKPQDIDLEIASGTDGVFEFRFWPPPPFRFWLRLTKAGVATMSGSWSQLEPGATKDLGEVRMPRGTLLYGRVVDSAGAPVAKVQVGFELTVRPTGEITHVSSDIGYDKPDGTFACRCSLSAGEYVVDVTNRTVVSPKKLTLSAGQAEQFVEVIVEAFDPSKSLAGIVVDERGSPVAGVMVRTTLALGGRRTVPSTDKEGRFRIDKPEQVVAEAVALSLEREGYERLTTTDKFPWGSTDIRITLQRALAVELSVVDAEGAPVEDYQVRIFPQPGTTSTTSTRDFEVRSKGRHEGGRATIQGIRRGRHFLVVEPKGEALAMSTLVPVEVADRGPSVVTVTLTRNAHRELRVQRPDGTPVAGAKAQLADLLAEMARTRLAPAIAAATKRVTPRMQVVSWDRWGFSTSSADRALELQSVTTDATGSARLHGPGDRALVLLLPGPGHVPAVVEDVRLGEAGPLVITLGSGGRLTGTVRPLTTISELRRSAKLPPTGPVAESDRRSLPRIELHRGQGAAAETHPAQLATISDDGTFSIADIPTGTWQVCLRWSHQGDTAAVNESEEVAAVTLQDGENRQIEIDVAHLAPGVLDGLVLHNGVALANARLMPAGSRGTVSVTTDAEGRFQLRARAGEYRISWQRQQGGVWSSLRAPESIHVVTGQTVAQTFHVKSGTVRVRLLDAQGQAVAQVRIELLDAAGQPQQSLPPTDADGRTSGEIEVEAFAAAVLPKHLQDPKARTEFHRNNPGALDPFAAVRVQCGTVQAQMGATTEVELRLAVAWPR